MPFTYWDNSNLFNRMLDTCDNLRDGTGGLERGHRLDVRLNFKAMYEFARVRVGRWRGPSLSARFRLV